jgi:hypothetical protein
LYDTTPLYFQKSCLQEAACCGIFEKTTDAVEKIIPVFVIPEYLLPFYSPHNHAMERNGRIYAGLTGHKSMIFNLFNRSIYVFMGAPYPSFG